MISEKRQRQAYIATDLVATFAAFFLFNMSRFSIMSSLLKPECASMWSFMFSGKLIAEMVLYPLMMLFVYWITGFYADSLFKSRLQVVGNALLCAGIGTMLFFFAALLNENIVVRGLYYKLLFSLFALNGALLIIVRMVIAVGTDIKIQSRNWGRNTLMLGAGPEAAALLRRLRRSRKSMGFKIVGLVDLEQGSRSSSVGLPIYNLDSLEQVCRDNHIQAFIVATKSGDDQKLMQLVFRLMPMELPIYVSPDVYNLASVRPHFSNVAAEPLVDVTSPNMPAGVANIKRTADVVVSMLALLILSPLIAALSIAIKIDSKGPVFYRQRRLGYHKRPFDILKFRSMNTDAEPDGPALSSPFDDRVTRMGRFMRKYRLDELPNFWNVLKGEMSIVGPRPEREYFIRQIVAKAPSYPLVHSVRPGITSWGMVKYGYAQNVDEMVERLRYDLLYLENMSIGVDFKILFYTINTVITGRGV